MTSPRDNSSVAVEPLNAASLRATVHGRPTENEPSPSLRLLAIVPLIAPRLCPPVGPQTSAEAICGGKVILGLNRAGVELDIVAFDQAGARVDDSSWWTEMGPTIIRFSDRSRGGVWSRSWKALKHRVPYWIGWVDEVVQRAQDAHRSRPYDAIYSRSLPAAAHLAGYRVSRLLGIPWVANMNDPWGPSVTPNCDDRVSLGEHLLTLYWLRRTLRAADAVTYPSHRLGIWHRRIGGRERRMEIIPHIGYQKPGPSRPNLFVVTHAGSLVSGRSGDVLLQAFIEFLAQAPEARRVSRLVFVGHIDEALKQQLAEHSVADLVSWTGTVNYERSIEFISESSVLVLIEKPYPEGIFLPSKLCDYFAAGKPVLALSPSEGVVADLAAQHRGIIVAHPRNKDGVRDALHQLYRSWTADRLDQFAPDRTLREMVDSELLTDSLVRVLNSVRRPTRSIV